MGSLKETVGRTVGSLNLQVNGGHEHEAGQEQLQAARSKGCVQGTAERAAGKKDELVGDQVQMH